MPDDFDDAKRQRHEAQNRAAEEYSRLQQMADEASERAVNKAFRVLGVDLNQMEDVNDFRDDLRFLRRQRRTIDDRKAETNKTIVTTIGGAIVGIGGSVVAWLLAGGHK